jgi:hypothetical protein
MANIDPNMGFANPVPGVDQGPAWAQDLYSALAIIGAHNHTPGQGVLIGVNGLTINGDLPFNSNNATLLRTVRFTPQLSPIASSAPDVGCLYVSGNELYYNDVSGGHQIQLTASGSVNATTSGISNGTATASFSGGVLVVLASSLTPANIQGASLLLGNNTASTNYLTLQPPSAMAANYSLTLPPIPGAISFLQIDTSGNITSSTAVAGGLTTTNLSASAGIVGTQLAANTLGDAQITLQGISAASILNATLTTTQMSASAGILATQLASPGFGQQAMSGNATYTSGTNTAINVSSIIFGSTRPIFWKFTGNSSAGGGLTIPAGWSITVNVQLGLTNVQQTIINNISGSSAVVLPMSAFNGWADGTSTGAGHQAILGITINTAGSGSVGLTATTMQVMQI